MWTDSDRLDALAWQAEQNEKCDGCGLPRNETMDPENEGRWDFEAWACHACVARLAKSRSLDEAGGVYLIPVDQASTNDVPQ